MENKLKYNYMQIEFYQKTTNVDLQEIIIGGPKSNVETTQSLTFRRVQDSQENPIGTNLALNDRTTLSADEDRMRTLLADLEFCFCQVQLLELSKEERPNYDKVMLSVNKIHLAGIDEHLKITSKHLDMLEMIFCFLKGLINLQNDNKEVPLEKTQKRQLEKIRKRALKQDIENLKSEVRKLQALLGLGLHNRPSSVEEIDAFEEYFMLLDEGEEILLGKPRPNKIELAVARTREECNKELDATKNKLEIQNKQLSKTEEVNQLYQNQVIELNNKIQSMTNNNKKIVLSNAVRNYLLVAYAVLTAVIYMQNPGIALMVGATLFGSELFSRAITFAASSAGY